MKVKIGDQIFDSEKEPVMLIFTNDSDRWTHANNINNFPIKEGERKYCVYPKGTPKEEVERFMK